MIYNDLEYASYLYMQGIELVCDPYVSDFTTEKRTLFERLFTFKPWTPFEKYKSVYKPHIIFMSDGTIVCSPLTYSKIVLELK